VDAYPVRAGEAVGVGNGLYVCL